MRFEDSPEPFISTPTPPPLPGGLPPRPPRRSGSPPEPRRPRRPEGDASGDPRASQPRIPAEGGTPPPASGGDRPEHRRPPRRSEPRGDAGGPGAPGGEARPSQGAPSRRRGDRGGRGERDRRPVGENRRGPRGGGEADRRSGPAPRTAVPATASATPEQPAPKSPPAAAPASGTEPVVPVTFLDELGGDLLASVSRSFYLTIRLLPEPLRGPISLGYLLARAMDTIADSPAGSTPTAQRLEHLRALAEMIKYGADSTRLRSISRDLSKRQKHAGERVLLEKIDRCLAWLESLEPAADRWDLQRALARIAHGQELDLMRFGATESGPGSGQEITALKEARELDDYTYFVAGSAGELWTRLCGRHLPDYATLPQAEMLRFGKRFGQGLQLVR